jgi:putative DNA-invertase from lambdoid prophage Rac
VSVGFLARREIAKIALYARVSTHDQQTLPMQLSAMRAYARRKGWPVTVKIEEIGSGAKTRPRREELLRAARRKEIDTIIVWRLDRWGRSLVDLVSTLQELAALKVGFVSLSEALDLTTPSGRAFAGMLSAPLRALRARTPMPAWARRAVGEGVSSCPRAGCGRYDFGKILR